MQNKKIAGLVMCGGKSIRMGEDKGLLKKNNTHWAEISFSKFKKISEQVFYSINTSQLEKYSKHLDKDKLIADLYKIPGPLAGLITASNQLQSDLLVLACDLIDLKEPTLVQLYESYTSHENTYDFIVFKNSHSIEPLAGVYTYTGLQKVVQMHHEDTLEKFSLKYILENGNTLFIPLKESQLEEFKNYNSPTML